VYLKGETEWVVESDVKHNNPRPIIQIKSIPTRSNESIVSILKGAWMKYIVVVFQK
jgi:hypothetical protein